MHPRKALRHAVVALLEEQLQDIEVTAKNPRAIPVPSVQVLTPLDEVRDPDLGGVSELRTTTLELAVRAKGDDIQDILDDYAEQIEDAIGTEVVVGDGRAVVSYTGAEQVLDSQSDERVGTTTLTFELAYATQRGRTR